ncbi:MAG: DMT family transporter, partial [Burkholderiales bacterium]|nr:DMT family transporter [Burkholderiales bacterium]
MPTHLRGIFALLIVTLAWGTTFPAMKDLTSYFTPVWIIFMRFFLAAMMLAPFLRGIRWQDLRIGLLMGALLFVCFIFQVEGLTLTSSNRNAFITGLNVLIVPLLGIALGNWPEKRIIFAVFLAILGLFALCWDGGGWSRGDNLTLVCAVAYAIYIKMMEVYSRRVASLMSFTAAQITGVFLSALAWLLISEVPSAPVEMRIDMAN